MHGTIMLIYIAYLWSCLCCHNHVCDHHHDVAIFSLLINSWKCHPLWIWHHYDIIYSCKGKICIPACECHAYCCSINCPQTNPIHKSFFQYSYSRSLSRIYPVSSQIFLRNEFYLVLTLFDLHFSCMLHAPQEVNELQFQLHCTESSVLENQQVWLDRFDR